MIQLLEIEVAIMIFQGHSPVETPEGGLKIFIFASYLLYDIDHHASRLYDSVVLQAWIHESNSVNHGTNP